VEVVVVAAALAAVFNYFCFAGVIPKRLIFRIVKKANFAVLFTT